MAIYKNTNFLVILISPSGGGKSSIANRVLEISENVDYSVSYTTRPPRGNEIDGKDYNFVSESEFEELLKQDQLLEHAQVHGYQYGTSRKYIENILSQGHHAILDIDVQGALQIIEKKIDAVTIFILPPSVKILADRLNRRKTDSPEAIEIRLKNARNELDYLDLDKFHYLVTNDNFDDAVQEVKLIISAEEKKISRIKNIKNTFYGG
jgi:guanylate kinase